MVLLASAALLPGCGRNPTVNFPTAAAYGRPDTCPERPASFDNGPGGVGSPDNIKCSYADANTKDATVMSGQVRAEGGQGHPGYAAEGMLVSVHSGEGVSNPRRPGPAITSTVSDAQGRFHLSGRFDQGRYIVTVRDPEGGPVLSFIAVDLDANRGGERQVTDLLLMLPLDERLRDVQQTLPPAKKLELGSRPAPGTGTEEPAETPGTETENGDQPED